MRNGLADETFELLFDTGADATDTLTDTAAAAEPKNALTHVLSLSMTKIADGLVNPKLVLSWLLTALGAPAIFIGLLVPIREAGALLPQLFTAARIHALGQRKWVWAAGSFVQGVSAAGIAAAGLLLEGAVAGAVICGLLAVLAVARSLCSVSYKDVLGKTVARTRRGTVTGVAGSAASVAVILFALALMFGLLDRMTLVLLALAAAGALWVAASALFSTLSEESNPTDPPGESPFAALSLLKEDATLRRFIVARGLLTATALAPPFLVLMASGEANDAFEALGALVLASALASFLSSYVWGRLSDRSSRWVLVLSGVLGAVALAGAVALSLWGAFSSAVVVAGTLFVLMIGYHGVRQGRSTYLVDMAPKDRRADYTAVANTVIGILLLGSGAFGAVASILGAVWAVAGFAAMSLAAAWVAFGLPEVETAAD
ncbi:MFS transporter [Rhodobacterales bacterium HKCCE2091]|nr:MFS transporter [Rhodobacterales bacterium HKCCE2091]